MKPITEQCGIPKGMSLGWVIDEFDSSFDTLAMASLRYHMDHAVTLCDGKRRATYKELLERFEEINARENFTREHLDHIDVHGTDFMDQLVASRTCDECLRHYRESTSAFDRKREDQQRARHDFIDIMPGLWS